MKLLFDLFPVILFFIAFKIYDIYIATAVAIAATMAQITYMKIKHGKVENMLVASGVIIAIFGGATLLLKDSSFIKWKPTILYWLLALTILVSGLFYKKYYVKDVLQKHIVMPDTLWARLNLAWGGFFIVMGTLNLYVAFNFSENTWVNFKLFGISAMMFLFIIVQMLLLSKYIIEEESSE